MNEKLFGALLEFQKQLPKYTKNTNNEYFKSKYATLDQITEIVLPALAGAGLVWTCQPTLAPEEGFALIYRLTHAESGEYLQGEYPLSDTASPQQRGSEITYARRYCLCAVTGVVADEDDDGNAANTISASTSKTVFNSRNKTVTSKSAEYWHTVLAKAEKSNLDELKKLYNSTEVSKAPRDVHKRFMDFVGLQQGKLITQETAALNNPLKPSKTVSGLGGN